ncbi:1084_t:CDS:2, partial [Acaulospora colombiana]
LVAKWEAAPYVTHSGSTADDHKIDASSSVLNWLRPPVGVYIPVTLDPSLLSTKLDPLPLPHPDCLRSPKVSESLATTLRENTLTLSPQPADAIMEPFDLWIATYDDKQLRPYGQVPESEEFSRRSSNSHTQLNPALLAMSQPSTSPTSSTLVSPEGSPPLGMRHLLVTLRRIEVDFKITNWEMQARSSVISMTFSPPPEIGGLVFRVDIPGKWWNEMRLTPEDVRGALRKEVVARLQGRLPEEVFVREYVKSLRADLEHCVHTLPVACFDFSLILPNTANGSGDLT